MKTNKNDPHENDLPIDPAKAKYIIPPGLRETFDLFLAHCEVAQNQPIMVVGDTGVGKSMFLHVFEKLYKEKYPESEVTWANCAHFGSGRGDDSLHRSELFGYEKGAFTGALPEGKAGLIEKADKGALILEEIGELAEEVQAMLLTFIETGKYNKVGSSKPQMAEVVIIGATNDEEALRNDFRYRFFPFYVPPLHRRREDVLYYMVAKYPELIKTFN